MANHTVSISLTLLVVAFAAAAATVSGLGGGGMVGGRTKVPNVKTNQEIQDLGRYSVEQYNHEQRTHNQKNGGDLKFQSVVEAETQVVAGTKYYLKISATDRNGVPQTFDAVLVVKPWVHSKELVGFSPSPATK